MSSITTAKKGIIDFLWEWAESHKEWGKLLISKIVLTENSLSPSDRENIFNYFLQSIGLNTGLTALPVEKPSYSHSNNSIELDSLSQITGVNKLAENQTINFSKNITIIYGSNGTGKTGYGRILKNLGFSYDLRKQILGNIYHVSTPQSATIKFKLNGLDNTFLWNGSNTNTELENISVFNNNCVQISLSDSRQLIVSPMGFHLFGLVTTELIELAKLLQSQITKYPTTLSWTESLNLGTLQQAFINRLSGTSTEQQLNEVALFTEEHQKILKDKENELKNLNKVLIQTEISNLSSQLNELRSLISKLQVAKGALTDSNWQLFLELKEQILDLEKKGEQGIKEIADLKGVTFYETKEFQSFIIAAENYVKVLNKSNYPAVDDLCVYCQQPLDDSARKLLTSYRQLLNDKTREHLEVLKKRKTDLIKLISGLDESLVLHQPSFGLDAEQGTIQPIEILDYNKNIRIAKARFTNEENVAASNHFNHDICINLITEKGILIKKILDRKENDLRNIDILEMNLKKVIAELKDRKLLSDKKEEIKKAILNHQIVSILNSNSNSFNTKSLSTKTSQARDELVSKNFSQIFEEELRAFRKSDVKIELNFGTSKGSSLVFQKIGSHQLAEILSEGEQKAVALAEFLTELQLDESKTPVIFDDPVNSLDHNITDDVARRLMRLSQERQVIIFTHSILLFNSFLYFSKQPFFKNLDCKFYNSRNEFDRTGFITDAEEEINSVKTYIKKINSLISNTPKDRNESDIAEDAYGYLRSAIELCVEQEIFQGTVKRYQKNVALTSFVKIDGFLVNSHKDKLNEIFERCCGYIKGHSNPAEIHNDPTLAELKEDFKQFESIRAAFIN